MAPKFSFIIPCYNSAETLLKTLNSITLQSLQDFEIILVDNNSTDDWRPKVEGLPVQIHHCRTQGPAPTRNLGAKVSSGSYLIFMDADVVIPPDWLQGLSEEIAKYPWVDIFSGTVLPRKLKNDFLYKYRLFILKEKTTTDNLLSINPAHAFPVVNASLCVYKKERFKMLNGYLESLSRLEDSYITIKAIFSSLHMKVIHKKAEVYYGPDNLFSYLIRSFQNGRGNSALKKILPSFKHAKRSLYKTEHAFLQYEIYRVLNNFCFTLGEVCHTLHSYPQESLVVRANRKNPFYFHFSLEEKLYGLNEEVSIIAHDLGLSLFHRNKYYVMDLTTAQLFLGCFRGKHTFSESEKMILKTWIDQKLFMVL